MRLSKRDLKTDIGPLVELTQALGNQLLILPGGAQVNIALPFVLPKLKSTKHGLLIDIVVALCELVSLPLRHEAQCMIDVMQDLSEFEECLRRLDEQLTDRKDSPRASPIAR